MLDARHCFNRVHLRADASVYSQFSFGLKSTSPSKTQLTVLIKSRTNKTDKPGKEAGGVAEMGMQEAQGSTLSPTVLGVLCNGSDSRPKEDHGRCGPLMETKASDAHQ